MLKLWHQLWRAAENQTPAQAVRTLVYVNLTTLAFTPGDLHAHLKGRKLIFKMSIHRFFFNIWTFYNLRKMAVSYRLSKRHFHQIIKTNKDDWVFFKSFKIKVLLPRGWHILQRAKNCFGFLLCYFDVIHDVEFV